MVFEREAASGHLQLVRELRSGNSSCLVTHQILALEEEEPGIVRFGVAAPAVEIRAVVDPLGDEALVERADQLVIHQHVGPARLMLELLDLADEPAVMKKERRARVVVALDQRLADEHLSRSGRVRGTVMHATLRIQQQPVERSALERGDIRGLLLPMRFVLMPLDQMRAYSLEPLGLDGGDTARVQARGLGQLRGHDPAPGLPSYAGAGMNPEADAARPEVIPFLGLRPDIAEQTGEQRLMHLPISRSRLRNAPAELGDQLLQLAMDVAPLAHAVEREEMLAAGLVQLAAGFPV